MKVHLCGTHGLTVAYMPSCYLCREAEVVRVVLHSTDPSAVGAVNSTLAQLPTGVACLWEYGGDFYVEDGFVAYACERQGYVKEVIR